MLEGPHRLPKRHTKKSHGTQAREARRGLLILKRAGLYGGTVPKGKRRGWQPTDYAEGQLEKYRDVVEGSAAAVSARKVKNKSAITVARSFKSAGLRVKGRKVVIPIEGDEKYSFNKKTGHFEAEFTTKRGKRAKKIIVPTAGGLFPPPKRGVRYAVAIPFNRGTGQRVDFIRWFNEKELREDMAKWYPRYKDWESYHVLEEIPT